MADQLDLTIVYQPPEDGWVVATIPKLPGVHSQGRTREEAREMVLSALNDWLRFYVEDHGAPDSAPAGSDVEPVHLTFAA